MAECNLSIALIRRVRKACLRMGIETNESVENGGTDLEAMLYALCIAIERNHEIIASAVAEVQASKQGE